MPKKRFNPKGRGYDYTGARAAGLRPDSSGHWPSRDPRTGLLFKGTSHPTFSKTRGAATRLGYEIKEGPGGRYFSIKKRTKR